MTPGQQRLRVTPRGYSFGTTTACYKGEGTYKHTLARKPTLSRAHTHTHATVINEPACKNTVPFAPTENLISIIPSHFEGIDGFMSRCIGLEHHSGRTVEGG